MTNSHTDTPDINHTETAYIIRECREADYSALVDLWERSVRATHAFLSEDDISEIKSKLASEYFPAVDIHILDVNGIPAGFIGVAGDKIEMLFIDSVCQGKGYGTALLDFAIGKGAKLVDVNEQNPAALGFYESKGFRTVSRDPTDDAGRPFPILHLSL